MSLSKKILHAIFTILIILQFIILAILYIKNPYSNFEKSFLDLFIKVFSTIIILFIISIIIFIFEHKKYNKKEQILDEEAIEPQFNIDDINNKDILYLSTVLKQKYPNKKEIILLIMQLINKKIIDLRPYFDGKEYKYIIEKRNFNNTSINDIENELLNYIFKNSNKVDLISTVKKIYYKNDINHILKKCYVYTEKIITIHHSPFNLLYKILAVIITFLGLYLGITISMITNFPLIFNNILSTNFQIIFTCVLLGVFCILIGFIFIVLLKKFNYSYQYNNDTYLWICKIILLLEIFLVICFLFPASKFLNYIIFIIFILALLAIMIKYNNHFSLSENDIIIRNKLISLKNYLKSFNYTTNKEFGNIITYENYIMYAFLFNITIKINEEFDLLQKELYNIAKIEGISYWKLLNKKI